LDEGLLNKIQELIEKGVGDIPRLEEIKERLEAGKILYQSDYDYIKEILSKYGLVDTADKPKEETSKSLSEYKTVSEIKKELGTATEKIESMEKKIEIQEKKTDSVKHRPTGVVVLGTLYIIVGLVSLLFAIVFGVLLSGLLGETFTGGMEILRGLVSGIAAMVAGIFAIVAAIEFIIAAALFSGKNWGRALVIVFVIIDLIVESASIAAGNFFAFVLIILDLVVLYYMWRPNVIEYYQAKN